MRTIPLSGSKNLSKSFTSEDFPQPLGPTNPTRSPTSTLKSKFL